ncbi:MAG: hypothetical protein RLZZ142_1351 [Verrucomicrobiota bacterium]|jgi:phosphotransferase system HPr (HPr) family protein
MRREVDILNSQGLHARPAAEFVRWARRYRAKVCLIKEGRSYSAASILELLSANLGCGTRVTLEVEGEEAQEAMERLVRLLEEFRGTELGNGSGGESAGGAAEAGNAREGRGTFMRGHEGRSMAPQFPPGGSAASPGSNPATAERRDKPEGV